MSEVVPAHVRLRPMRSGPADPRRWGGLYPGEVLAIVYPDDPGSLTKRFVEYRVAAQAYVNGTTATVEFPHALLANSLAGLADEATHTLRADPKSGEHGQPGLGSKVLVACLNGDSNNAVILGGIRDSRAADGPKAKDLGHRWSWRFNGVSATVDKDGAVTVRRDGPTRPDGKLASDKDPGEEVGAYVRLDAAGGVTLATVRKGKEEQRVALDHAKGELTITAQKGLTVKVVDGPVRVEAKGDAAVVAGGAATVRADGGDVTVQAPKGKVHLGGSGGEPVPLGDKLVGLLQDLLTAIQAITVSTAVGPSSPPLNAAQFAALLPRLQTLLSRSTDVKPTP